MGKWFPGERVVFRGRELFQDLKGLPWMALLLFGITGRIPDDKQIRLFEGIWVLCTSYPDPRLWNNRVAALAGTVRSTATLGVSAAIAVSEASIYGHRPTIRAMDFLRRTRLALDQGADLGGWVVAELRKYRNIAGYGRPAASKDERIEPLMALADELGFAEGPLVRLAFGIEEVLGDGRWRLRMNAAAVAAGLVADQGLSAQEYYRYSVLCFTAGMFPAYLEGLNKPEGAFFPLRCERIRYLGEPPGKKWQDRRTEEV
jgi:hypothetical protein